MATLALPTSSVHPRGLAYLVAVVREINQHGPDVVFDNRVHRADLFCQQHDEDGARRCEEDAEVVLSAVG